MVSNISSLEYHETSAKSSSSCIYTASSSKYSEQTAPIILSFSEGVNGFLKDEIISENVNEGLTQDTTPAPLEVEHTSISNKILDSCISDVVVTINPSDNLTADVSIVVKSDANCHKFHSATAFYMLTQFVLNQKKYRTSLCRILLFAKVSKLRNFFQRLKAYKSKVIKRVFKRKRSFIRLELEKDFSVLLLERANAFRRRSVLSKSIQMYCKYVMESRHVRLIHSVFQTKMNLFRCSKAVKTLYVFKVRLVSTRAKHYTKLTKRNIAAVPFKIFSARKPIFPVTASIIVKCFYFRLWIYQFQNKLLFDRSLALSKMAYDQNRCKRLLKIWRSVVSRFGGEYTLFCVLMKKIFTLLRQKNHRRRNHVRVLRQFQRKIRTWKLRTCLNYWRKVCARCKFDAENSKARYCRSQRGEAPIVRSKSNLGLLHLAIMSLRHYRDMLSVSKEFSVVGDLIAVRIKMLRGFNTLLSKVKKKTKIEMT